jgi:fructokinase
MLDSLTSTPPPIVAAIGEALFDCFPDKVVLGGAPVNFAVHLQQLIGEPAGQVAVVSGIGKDELGARLINEVSRRRVRTDYTQTVAGRETGQVHVTFSSAGEPAYEIAEDAAWDFIAFSDALRQLAERVRLVYFGTLAQRSAQSRATIQSIVTAATGAVRLLDLNLRPPHVDVAIIDASLSLANVVKLNADELRAVAAILPRRLGGGGATDELVARLLQSYELQLVALTRGPRGTVLYTADGRIEGSKPSTANVAADADSVGAGDACCAGLAYGLLMDWPLTRTLELANRLGAYVASQPGGTPELPGDLLPMADAHRTAITS